jgi:hypothetical protein
LYWYFLPLCVPEEMQPKIEFTKLSLRIVFLFAFWALLSGQQPAPARQLILWTGERPDDLRFLNPAESEVAFVSQRFFLRADRVIGRPVAPPVHLDPLTRRIAVFRIDTDAIQKPVFSLAQRNEIAAQIVAAARALKISSVQIDFDAKMAEREFYRSLLEKLRGDLTGQAFLSITAPVEWCSAGSWLEGLPVDEVVPMAFRTGKQRPSTDYTFPLCQTAVGVSVEELLGPVPSQRRIYIYSPQGWTEDLYRKAVFKFGK